MGKNTTDVKETTSSTSFVLLPNPASTYISVNRQDIVKLIVYDQTGRSGLNQSGDVDLIDVSCLSTGVYTLNLVSEAGAVQVERFLKKRN